MELGLRIGPAVRPMPGPGRGRARPPARRALGEARIRPPRKAAAGRTGSDGRDLGGTGGILLGRGGAALIRGPGGPACGGPAPVFGRRSGAPASGRGAAAAGCGRQRAGGGRQAGGIPLKRGRSRRRPRVPPAGAWITAINRAHRHLGSPGRPPENPPAQKPPAGRPRPPWRWPLSVFTCKSAASLASTRRPGATGTQPTRIPPRPGPCPAAASATRVGPRAAPQGPRRARAAAGGRRFGPPQGPPRSAPRPPPRGLVEIPRRSPPHRNLPPRPPHRHRLVQIARGLGLRSQSPALVGSNPTALALSDTRRPRGSFKPGHQNPRASFTIPQLRHRHSLRIYRLPRATSCRPAAADPDPAVGHPSRNPPSPGRRKRQPCTIPSPPSGQKNRRGSRLI